jgi:hypothetical protein
LVKERFIEKTFIYMYVVSNVIIILFNVNISFKKVALDFGETGTQGSTAFVQDFLIRSLLRPQRFPEFQVSSTFLNK